MKKLLIVSRVAAVAILSALLITAFGVGTASAQSAADATAGLPAGLQASLPDGLYAIIKTPRGAIVLELYADKAPLATASFVGLAEGNFSPSGKPYFDGVTFHRVEPGFVIQGGDPTGTGRGGPGYQFPNEIDPSLGFGAAGVVGMANAGPDTNGSQFYITLGPAPFLDGSYTVFGRVVSGMEAVKAIRKGDAMLEVRIARKGTRFASYKADKAEFDAAKAAYAAKAGERAAAATARQFAAIETRVPGLGPAQGGIRSKILRQGDGRRPKAGERVRILYTLTLSDGKKVDSTADRGGKPFEFALGQRQVIEGFDAAVAAMSYGEKRVVAIPPELGYGSRGSGAAVPPNSVLVFEIELLNP